MEAVLAELPLDDRLAGALLLQSGPEGRLLAAALAHERADWDRLGEAPATLVERLVGGAGLGRRARRRRRGLSPASGPCARPAARRAPAARRFRPAGELVFAPWTGTGWRRS